MLVNEEWFRCFVLGVLFFFAEAAEHLSNILLSNEDAALEKNILPANDSIPILQEQKASQERERPQVQEPPPLP